MTRIKAANFRPFEQNTLIGFCDLTLPEIGLTIRDCPVHRKGESRWVSMPGKPVIDRATKQIQIDPQTQRPRYVNILDWTNADARREFQDAAVAAVRVLRSEAKP